jgi:radical SAM protein with 4Fe4S-binding SPASM domain
VLSAAAARAALAAPEANSTGGEVPADGAMSPPLRRGAGAGASRTPAGDAAAGTSRTPAGAAAGAAARGLPRPEPIVELPILILFPHSRCNCRCLMCDIWRDTAKREIATEEVAAWAPEWRRLGVRQVALSGGEALLHSDLWALCDHLTAAGIAITLLSTGLLLRRDAPRIARCCAEVIVSLDGPPAVHDEVRNLPRAYAKLAEGVAALHAAAPALPIGGRCTVQRANFRHLRATVAAARDAGLDRLSFLAADVSTDAFNRPLPWEPGRVAEVALAAADLPHLAAELDALERDCAAELDSGYIVEDAAKLRRRLYGYYAALHGQGDFPPNRCNAPWVSTVIEADGTVRPCFFQPPLGNLRREGNLEAILNSPAALAWRAGLDVARDRICRKCVCTLAWEAAEQDGAPAANGRTAAHFAGRAAATETLPRSPTAQPLDGAAAIPPHGDSSATAPPAAATAPPAGGAAAARPAP